jgi:hypothetical protein
MGAFAVDTLDLADIEWSPDDSSIVIWDAPLEFKVMEFFFCCIYHLSRALDFISTRRSKSGVEFNAYIVPF